MIGATTIDEYRKYIEKDAALERRFQPVTVEEPTEEEAIEILHGLRPYYERHHGVTITDEALTAAVRLAERYINDRRLPDKAIDLIDEASSKVRIGNFGHASAAERSGDELALVRQEKEAAVLAHDMARAQELERRQEELEKKNGRTRARLSGKKGRMTVTEDAVADVVA